MYLPRTLPLCTPHLAFWTGKSGRSYDFAILRTGTVWIDEPAVYILARHGDAGAQPLLAGETQSLQLQFNGRLEGGIDEWRAAMASGMTHVHVRFEATTADARHAEVADLIAALQPPLNAVAGEYVSSAAGPAGSDVFAGTAVDAGSALGEEPLVGQAEPALPQPGTAVVRAEVFVDEDETPTVRVPYRVGRLSPSRPSVEFGEPATAQWLDEPVRPAWQLRADPAREFDAAADADALYPAAESEYRFAAAEIEYRSVTAEEEHLSATAAEAISAQRSEVRQDKDFIAAPVADASAAATADGAAATPETAVVVPPPADLPAVDPHAADTDTVPATAHTPAADDAPAAAAGGRHRGGLLSRLLNRIIGRSHPDHGPTTGPVLMPVSGTLASAAESEVRGEPSSDLPADGAPVAAAPVAAADADETPVTDATRAEDGGGVPPAQPAEAALVAFVQPERAPLGLTEPAMTHPEAPQADDEAEALAFPTIAPVSATHEAPACAPAPRDEPQRDGALVQERLATAKRDLALDPQAPVVLYAGDIGWHGGADILFEAMLIVCAGHSDVQFVYAGDGPLRGELQERAGRAALGPRCRFLGDVPAGQFPAILAAADFVAIPARSPQGEDLTRAALAQGKPVLVTHQAGLGCVVHGVNGLVTYDNPGSFVWGVRELLGPLYGDLRRQLDRAA